jgi:hypothetical protein
MTGKIVVCPETRLRVRLTAWAYAYEFENDSLVSDAEFDAACREVDLTVRTARPDLDEWWIDNFDPSTGQWIHSHPELDRARNLYWRLKSYQQPKPKPRRAVAPKKKPPVQLPEEDDLDALAASLI